MLVRINQDIQDIQQAIATVLSRIDLIHLEYAQAISGAIKQQVLLVVFKFCTQKHPQAFLSLSLSERQKLQEELRQMIKLLSDRIQTNLQECDRTNRINQENLDILLANNLNEIMEALNKLLTERMILNADRPQDDREPQLSIRLAEIEFTDRQVMSYRGELRVLSARLLHLQTELEKKYQQKMIVEAELAWRSAWVES